MGQEERGSCGVCQEKGHGILHSKIRGKGAERQEDQADSRSFKVLGVSLQIQVWLQEQIEIVEQRKRKESFQQEQEFRGCGERTQERSEGPRIGFRREKIKVQVQVQIKEQIAIEEPHKEQIPFKEQIQIDEF